MSRIPTFYAENVSAEAGAWLARLHASDLTAQDEMAFQAWLEADPAHAAAFEHATSVWDRLGAIPRELYVPKKWTATVFNRRALMTAAAGVAIAGGSIPFLRGAQAHDYQTDIGQQSHVPLADGSGLFLDTNTSVTVNLSGNRRLVELRYGRVNCRVAPNDRPFAVQAGDRLVVGNRSVFDVSNSGDYFSVVLINGNAEVSSSQNKPIELRQGDRATATYENPLWCDRPDLSSLTAWQTGRLIFRNETVSDAVEQVNRYSTVKIEVDDSHVAALRMSGGYVVGDTLGFAVSLSQLLPVQVRLADGKIKLVTRPNI